MTKSQDQAKAHRAIWHRWLLQRFEDSENQEVRCELASLLCLSGLEWENDGPEHDDFLSQLRDAETKEENKEVRLQLGLAIEALDPTITRPRRSLASR